MSSVQLYREIRDDLYHLTMSLNEGENPGVVEKCDAILARIPELSSKAMDLRVLGARLLEYDRPAFKKDLAQKVEGVAMAITVVKQYLQAPKGKMLLEPLKNLVALVIGKPPPLRDETMRPTSFPLTGDRT